MKIFMKKIILILLVLIITAADTFATEISDPLADGIISEEDCKIGDPVIGPNSADIFVNESPIIEDSATENHIIEQPRAEDHLIEAPAIEDEAIEDSAVKPATTDNNAIEAAVPDKKAPQKATATDTLLDKVDEINSMQDDTRKIKEWAKFNSEKNYVIIDKKDCIATVYDKEGNEITDFEIGIGKEIGDDFNDTKGLLGKPKNTTPAGEYTLITNIYNKSAYGDITLSLGSKANKSKTVKKMVALHKVPKFRQKDRLKKFNDGNLANNRMSHGCINFLEDDFNELTKYIHGGLKVFVLPEESDNKLILTKNNKNEFELTQTKY